MLDSLSLSLSLYSRGIMFDRSLAVRNMSSILPFTWQANIELAINFCNTRKVGEFSFSPSCTTVRSVFEKILSCNSRTQKRQWNFGVLLDSPVFSAIRISAYRARMSPGSRSGTCPCRRRCV